MTPAATVALEPAPPRVSKRVPRDVFHLVACQRIRIGYITCGPGEPLCGTTAALEPCPPGLFPPQVSCPRCAAIAARERISAAGAVPR